jgi:uncharacterized integral membrane protein
LPAVKAGVAEGAKETAMNAGKIKLILAIVLALVAIIWVVQNHSPVETKFIFVTVTMPQAALLTITLLIGLVAGILLTLSLSGRSAKKEK